MNEEQKKIVAGYKTVGKSFPKKDSSQLLSGQPVFTDDITPSDCLVVKLVRSPYAHALVTEIDTKVAMRIPGVVAIYTYKDVPQKRFTHAGQTFAELSPQDRLLIDQRVRFVGDVVAIVAGETEEAVDRAIKMVKVKYEVLEPVLDFRAAKDNDIIIHPEDNWQALVPVGADNKRNLVAHAEDTHGDVDGIMDDCDVVLKHSYHVRPANQAMMETFRTYTEIDRYGRLHVISSTQIVYHCRRIIANALDIPKSKVRVEKPRIGGGFGAKQTVVTEVYPAFVTWKTKRPAKMIYSRYESMIAATPRHEMEVTIKIGAMNDGTIRALDMYTLSNSGAYGEHGPTTVGLSGHKSLPIYTANCEAHRFDYDVVYTNVQAAGAYRGYGATQGVFALECIVNELAYKLDMDPMELRMKNIVREGMTMPAYDNEVANACALDECIMRCSKDFDWENKKNPVDLGNGKIRAAGMALAMQGSCISNVDVGSCTIKLGDEGTFNMLIAAADMGTGCDTILAQMAAEILDCELDDISVFGADTDASPYDSGSYASSTTYITGMATKKAATELRDNMIKIAAGMLDKPVEELEYCGDGVYVKDGEGFVSRSDIATKSMCFNTIPATVTASHSSPVSPPPWMAAMVEIELDKETGEVEILDYHAVVDCGIPVNPALARVQAEGGITQGIGMALTENITYNKKGRILENSLMNYKIPSRLDNGRLNIEFEKSYEPTGPFGVKSIGEIVINTPAPALVSAIAKATGVWHRDLPVTPQKILLNMDYE